jgi:CO/xanthine dehydrogenase Mo-binding subunit
MLALFHGSAGTTSALNDKIPTIAFEHATMEPMNCTARVAADGCDIWAPAQGQEMTQLVISQVLGLPKEKVRVNRTLTQVG